MVDVDRLKRALAIGPSQLAFRAIACVLESAAESECRELLTIAQQGVMDWPDETRIANWAWCQAVADGAHLAAWSLVRFIDLSDKRIGVEPVDLIKLVQHADVSHISKIRLAQVEERQLEALIVHQEKFQSLKDLEAIAFSQTPPYYSLFDDLRHSLIRIPQRFMREKDQPLHVRMSAAASDLKSAVRTSWWNYLTDQQRRSDSAGRLDPYAGLSRDLVGRLTTFISNPAAKHDVLENLNPLTVAIDFPGRLSLHHASWHSEDLVQLHRRGDTKLEKSTVYLESRRQAKAVARSGALRNAHELTVRALHNCQVGICFRGEPTRKDI